MDSRGGCCIAKYGGGYDISTVNRIMMKFRPIAPKPANGTSSSPEISETSPKSGRGRKRLTTSNATSTNNRRCNKGGNSRKRKEKTDSAAATVVTLPLLLETPDMKNIIPTKESPEGVINLPGKTKSLPTTWLSFGRLDRTVTMPPSMTLVVGSCVTVECVTDTWMDADGSGCTGREGRINLERDTCPGFISDGFGRVTWTNEAYRKMAMEGEDGKGEVVVWLAMKDKPAVTAALASGTAFTCRVRVQNQRSCSYGKEKSSITLPCDVWRMDGGDFAWRLDVTTALSLGR